MTRHSAWIIMDSRGPVIEETGAMIYDSKQRYVIYTTEADAISSCNPHDGERVEHCWILTGEDGK